MAKTVFKAEMGTWPEDQSVKTHNRWHPDVPFVEWFKPGDEFRVETYDWTGGQIKNDESANDIRDVVRFIERRRPTRERMSATPSVPGGFRLTLRSLR